MPRVVAAKCPWPACGLEWTDAQRETVLWEIGYLKSVPGVPGEKPVYAGRGVSGSAHCPACGKLVDVVANPNLPLIVTKYRPRFTVVRMEEQE